MKVGMAVGDAAPGHEGGVSGDEGRVWLGPPPPAPGCLVSCPSSLPPEGSSQSGSILRLWQEGHRME